MSKTISKTLAVVAFAMIAGYNMYQSNSKTEGMSELMLANVEALAGGENGSFNCRWDSSYTICYLNGSQLGYPCYSHNW